MTCVQGLIVVLLVAMATGIAYLLALATFKPEDIIGELEPQHRADGKSIMRHMRVILLVGLLATLFLAAFAVDSWGRKVTWSKTGASVYNGCTGARGNVCTGYAFAELGGCPGSAMGGLAYGTKIRVLYRHRKITLRKRDCGGGGASVGGFARGLDLPCSSLARLRLGDCENWTAVVQWRVVR